MKKLITIYLFIATTFAVNAQNKTNTSATATKSGPTKEQTLEYLKATLVNVWGGVDTDSALYQITLWDLTIDGCVLKFNIDFSVTRMETTSTQSETLIDLSLVESLEIKARKLNAGSTPSNENLVLFFKIQNKVKEVRAYCKPEDSEKVFKAFNHLRKLCGAPDPISFD